MRVCTIVMLRTWFRAVSMLGIISVLVTCATLAPDTVDELTPDVYFQNAQEASANYNYQRAMRWYKAFVERYQNQAGFSSDQTARLLWAAYEIAFLHHKLGEDEKALILLQELVDRYQNSKATSFPPAPRILAERIIKELASYDET